MWKFVLGLVAATLVTLNVVSVIEGWMPNHADAAFLATLGIDIVMVVLWMYLSPYFDRTNGNDTGIFAFAIVVTAAALAFVAAPVVVVLGAVWWVGVLAGTGLALAGAILGGCIIRG